MINTRFNPEMFALAREFRGLTQKELARRCGKDQSVISRVEHDQIEITDDLASTLASELTFPVEFFTQQERIVGFGASYLFHRKRQTTLVGDVKRIEAEVNVARLNVRQLLQGMDMMYEYDFPPLEVGIDGPPEAIARLVRAAWDIPSGPVRNLTEVIERAGGIVIRYPFSSKNVDGLSLRAIGTPPLFFLNETASADRDRWTLAHELGHIVMHRIPHAKVEEEANQFAAEFLMPGAEIRRELTRVSLPTVASLKFKWLVSMAAILRRAVDLKTITPNAYRYLLMQMSAAGWKKQEPNALEKEQANNLRNLIEAHQRDNGYSIEELSQLSYSNVEDFTKRLLPSSGPRLRMSP